MSFEICRGTPQYSGRYACYLPGVGLPTVVRLFIVGRGWCDNLHEKISGDVAGWIGPLPTWPENSVRFDVASLFPEPSVRTLPEYDL